MKGRLRSLLDADWARLMSVCGTPQRKRSVTSHLSPRFAPVALIRIAAALAANGWKRSAKLFSLLNFIIFGIEVPAHLDIGPGLIIAHTQGTVLGAARIGANLTLFHQVTLGAKLADYGYNPELRPIVGDNVTLCVGAKVLGPVNVGDDAVVGANAVVLNDVPAGMLAVGVPAKNIAA